MILLTKAVGSLSFDDGAITWYSRDEIYWGKKTLNFIDYLVGFSKMGNKIGKRKIEILELFLKLVFKN
jgi:hypothetical protein